MVDILLYQPGRVGSTACVKSLKNQGFNKVFHVHHYDEKKRPIPTHISCKETYSIKNPKIITLVRYPIDRNLSSFTFRLSHYMSSHVRKIGPSDELKTEFFLKLFRHDYILNWFDNEFYKNTGINVYNYEFDKLKGYTIIDGENLLILKSENISETFEEATEKFLGEKVKLIIKKRYPPPYLGMIKYLPANYFKEMHDNKYVEHFY